MSHLGDVEGTSYASNTFRYIKTSIEHMSRIQPQAKASDSCNGHPERGHCHQLLHQTSHLSICTNPKPVTVTFNQRMEPPSLKCQFQNALWIKRTNMSGHQGRSTNDVKGELTNSTSTRLTTGQQ